MTGRLAKRVGRNAMMAALCAFPLSLSATAIAWAICIFVGATTVFTALDYLSDRVAA